MPALRIGGVPELVDGSLNIGPDELAYPPQGPCYAHPGVRPPLAQRYLEADAEVHVHLRIRFAGSRPEPAYLCAVIKGPEIEAVNELMSILINVIGDASKGCDPQMKHLMLVDVGEFLEGPKVVGGLVRTAAVTRLYRLNE